MTDYLVVMLRRAALELERLAAHHRQRADAASALLARVHEALALGDTARAEALLERVHEVLGLARPRSRAELGSSPLVALCRADERRR